MSEPEEPDFDALERELDMSPMDEDAAQMHELFTSLLRAGFKERQALFLVAMIVNEVNSEIGGLQINTYTEDDEDFED